MVVIEDTQAELYAAPCRASEDAEQLHLAPRLAQGYRIHYDSQPDKRTLYSSALAGDPNGP